MTFLWGASISSHQVEGGLENDWTRWERQNATRWARTGPLERIQDLLGAASRPPAATDPDNYISGQATDHFNRYEEDAALADDIGLNALRFSLEWSRLQPTPGDLDAEAVAHYREKIQALRDRGIEPIVTVWHYAHPQWFVDDFGWHHAVAPAKFRDYTERVAEAFGDLVTYWITMNEPAAYVRAAYVFDGFPPAKTKVWQAPRAWRNLVRAHNQAYGALDDADNLVGVSLAAGSFEPYTDTVVNRKLAGLLRHLEHDAFLQRLLPNLDFIGINYYIEYEVDVLGRNLLNGSRPRSDMGWPLSPGGLEQLCKRLARYDLPLMVTEHGLADSDDEHRGWYIRESVAALERAREAGVPINGYLHWSLTDNFEWDKGFWPRFGLAAVDYDDHSRTLRDSTAVYADIIAERDWEATWQENGATPQE
jgi:beta-glucosidase